ncbi:MAG: hypothetical protein GXP49_14275 [Deltaproteobacteria bacterium]|nr:hypothetical protein [Deltaproteobacteria bacterium]
MQRRTTGQNESKSPNGILVYANKVIPCGAPGQPTCSSARDRNLELWYVRIRSGHPLKPVRLTSNSNGIPDDPTCRDSDDDIFLAPVKPGPKTGPGVLLMNRLDGDDDIYFVALDKPTPLNLTDNHVDDAFVDLSKDGSVLYFANRSDGDADLYATKVDGSVKPYKVISTTSDERFLKVAGGYAFYSLPGPDGREALFGRRLDGGPSSRFSPRGSDFLDLGAVIPNIGKVIFTIRTGSKTSIVSAGLEDPSQFDDLSGPRDSAMFRLCSLDGKYMVFTANDRPLAGGGAGDVEIYTVPVKGKAKPKLLTAFENESYFLPKFFTRDGKAVLYESPVDGDLDIYELPLDGGPPHNLTANHPGPDKLLGLAGDGLLVARPDINDGVDDEIFYLEPQGKVVELTNNQVQDTFCAFFPENSK